MENTVHHTERELLAQLSTGDRVAFTRIYTEHYSTLYRYLYIVTKSAEEAEEILQDVFLKLWNKRATLTGVISLKDYLFRMAKNRVFDEKRKKHPERNQGRIRATLWERPDLYISNSPIFRAHKVSTPLLMMNNKGDKAVPFAQGVQFFMALRRLSKKVWMLQYDEGRHSVDRGKDAEDFHTRMIQFFDYYLKDCPPPAWMVEGIPARKKGVEDGLELEYKNKRLSKSLLE